MAMRLRRGHFLAEALCALALAGVLMASAGLVLTGARRRLEVSEHRDRTERAGREAAEVVRHVLDTGSGIVLRGDTAVEVDMLLGASVVCSVEPRAVVLPPPRDGTGLTLLPQAVTPDDLVALRLPSDAEEEWWYGAIDAVQEHRLPGVCDAARGWRSMGDAAAPVLRLLLRDPVPADVATGTPVRVIRRGRFTLYRAGSGEWMLGWRRCLPVGEGCGVVQPVAGPLASPRDGGLRVGWLSGGAVGIAVEARGAGGGRGARAEVHW
jgi:hypothetical protein